MSTKTDTKSSTQTAAETLQAAGDSFKAAGEVQKRVLVEYAQAAADMGGHMDRMVRAQLGHAAAVQKTAAEFVTQSVETGLKAQDTLRRTGVELVESFAK